MEQDPSLLQDQAEVTDDVVADKVDALKNEKMGPPGPCSSRSALGTPCLGPVGLET